VAIGLTRDGQADAAVSAGNTGAGMAIGMFICRTLEGIDRPALAAILPNISKATVLIDVGANVDCKPLHLLQFAVMGHVYAQELLKIENPRIGLLSTGEESTKGNTLTKEVFEPLSQANLNFIGNAEGRDVFNGRADVIVCDGFTGNVILKASESLEKTIRELLKEGFATNWRTKLGYLLAKPALGYLKKRTDYTEYGGAPLLGLNNVVIISHGSSKAKAMKNAIRVASESVTLHLQEKIAEMVVQCEFDVKSRRPTVLFWRHLKGSIRHEGEKGKTFPEKPEQAEQEERTEETTPIIESEQAQELIQEQVGPPEPEPEKPQEPEPERRSWWRFKESKYREQSEIDQDHVTETPKQPQTEEQPSESEPQ
jgi:glycerol-3-phosphate acyltransferase PlsX